MSLQSPSVTALLKAALAAHQAGKLDDAAALYRRVIDADPRADVAHHNLGLIDHAQGRLAEAAATIRIALQINPRSASYLTNLASVLEADRQSESALALVDQALALEPGLAAAHNTRGLCLADLDRDSQAEEAFGRALQIEPRYVEAVMNLARHYLKRGRNSEAQQLAETAIRLRPKLARAYLLFGDVALAEHKVAAAVEGYRRAIALGLDNPETNAKLGGALSEAGDVELALPHLERAVALAPHDSSAQWALGRFWAQRGELDEAAARFRKALAIDPERAAIRNALAHTVKHKSPTDDDVAGLVAAYASSLPGSEQRMHIAFGLAKALEDLKDYGAAFDRVVEGNAIRRAGFDYATDRDAAAFTQIKETFTSGFLARQAGHGSQSDRPLFILGMPRSGTTLTEQILASHPDVFGAGELQFMEGASVQVLGLNVVSEAKRLAELQDLPDYAAIARTYLEWLPKSSDGFRFVTDKLPQNFIFAGLMHLVFPNSRIVHVRRAPLDNCLSIYKNFFGSDGMTFGYDLTELGRYYNLYRDLMQHWHRVMPGVIHDVQYEDLVSKPEATSRALLQYCGLDWRPEVLDFHLSKREIKTASFAQVRRPIYKDSVNLAARYGDRLQPLIDALAEWKGED